MHYKDFHESVLYWARIRGFDESDPRSQYLSCVEESVKEISESKMNLDDAMLSDAIGDTAVTLIILDLQLKKKNYISRSEAGILFTGDYTELMYRIGCIGASLRREKWDQAALDVSLALACLIEFCNKEGMYFDECCGHAWDEIKDRVGMMINGSYVKESDLNCLQRLEFDKRIVDARFPD